MPGQSKKKFQDLVERCRDGNQDAVAELAQLYEPEIRRMARALLGPALRPYFDSVDLVQSVHRTLITGLRRNKFNIDAPENLLALTVTLVRRKIARHWRSMRRQQRLDAVGNSSVMSRVLTSIYSNSLDPAEIASINDQVERLLDGLDEAERRLVELRLEGHRTAEAARKLGLDADVLRVRLSRLRQRLRASGLLVDWL